MRFACQGFVSNKDAAQLADSDPVERLLYGALVAATSRSNVGHLASILNEDVDRLCQVWLSALSATSHANHCNTWPCCAVSCMGVQSQACVCYISQAISIACRLGFATRLAPVHSARPVLTLHRSGMLCSRLPHDAGMDSGEDVTLDSELNSGQEHVPADRKCASKCSDYWSCVHRPMLATIAILYLRMQPARGGGTGHAVCSEQRAQHRCGR